MIFQTANQYVVDGLVQLSKQRTVAAAEDIYDERGVKLWAKGKPVSEALQQRLLQRKLAKPLETALEVENALSFSDILAELDSVLEEKPLLRKIAGPAAISLLKRLKSITLPAPIRLLLTSAQANGLQTYRHTLSTMLVAAGIASHLKAPESEAQHLVLAALLHDIGEMYINPDYLKSTNRLQPHEWKHVASHPRIGELLIKSMTKLPPAVAQIVGQHHERLDGSGYPQQAKQSTQHHFSNWLGVADSAAAILAPGDDGAPQRLALALRIVPAEFDRDAVSAVISLLRQNANGDHPGYGRPGESHDIERAKHAWEHVQAAIEEVDRLEAAPHVPLISSIANHTRAVLLNLGKSLVATGAIETDQLGDGANDSEVLSEIALVNRETEWRMRNLARNIYLCAENASNDKPQLDAMQPLIGLLNDIDSPLPTVTATLTP